MRIFDLAADLPSRFAFAIGSGWRGDISCRNENVACESREMYVTFWPKREIPKKRRHSHADVYHLGTLDSTGHREG
jgi:hypothetical protein